MNPERPSLKAALVQTAAVLLDEGLEAVSLRRVAMAAGVSPMAPYRHFKDKAALLGAVAEEGFADLCARLATADASARGREALIAQGLAYVVFARERPALFRLMFSTPEQVCLPNAAADGAYAVLSARVAGLFPQDSEAMITGCWGLVHGLATLSMSGPSPIEDDRIEAILLAMVPASPMAE